MLLLEFPSVNQKEKFMYVPESSPIWGRVLVPPAAMRPLPQTSPYPPGRHTQYEGAYNLLQHVHLCYNPHCTATLNNFIVTKLIFPARHFLFEE